ncbi:MAG: ribosome maturation factor RimM [Pseudomonadota bacterium]
MDSKLILIGRLNKPHGIKGQAKLTSYTEEPKNIFSYPYLLDEKLNKYIIKFHSQKENNFIISFNDNISRNLAEEISGTNLYITRDMLPKPLDNEYYHADLIGSEILSPEGVKKGKLIAIHNFGAGDILEMQIDDSSKTIFLPFEDEFILRVDITKKFVIFNFNKAGITT